MHHSYSYNNYNNMSSSFGHFVLAFLTCSTLSCVIIPKSIAISELEGDMVGVQRKE